MKNKDGSNRLKTIIKNITISQSTNTHNIISPLHFPALRSRGRCKYCKILGVWSTLKRKRIWTILTPESPRPAKCMNYFETSDPQGAPENLKGSSKTRKRISRTTCDVMWWNILLFQVQFNHYETWACLVEQRAESLAGIEQRNCSYGHLLPGEIELIFFTLIWVQCVWWFRI